MVSHMYIEHFGSLTKPSFLSRPLLSSLPPRYRFLSPFHAFLFIFVTLIEPDCVWTLAQNYPLEPDELIIGYTTESNNYLSLPHIPSVAKNSSGSGKDSESFLERNAQAWREHHMDSLMCELWLSIFTFMCLTRSSCCSQASRERKSRGVNRTQVI